MAVQWRVFFTLTLGLLAPLIADANSSRQCSQLFSASKTALGFDHASLAIWQIQYRTELTPVSILGQTVNNRTVTLASALKYQRNPQLSYQLPNAGFELVKVIPVQISHVYGQLTHATASIMHSAGLGLVDYEGRVQSKLKNIIHQVDLLLEPERIVAQLVVDQNENVVGAIRYFYGSRLINDPSYARLPCERILAQLGIKTVPAIQAFRAQGTSYVELGKFFHLPELNGHQAEAVRDLIERAILAKLSDMPSGTVIVAHVATPVHLRAYRSYYGFEVLNNSVFEIEGVKHSILSTTRESLMAKLNERIESRRF
jgi:hypothetical protein